MKYLLLICCVISLSSAKNPVLLNVEDHYWRDYTGLIAPDAIKAGVNDNGEDLYVAQMELYHDGSWDLVPAGISQGSTAANASYWFHVKSVSDKSRIKVMCTSNPERYHWFGNKEIVPPGCRYVVAGRESDSPLYVGRAQAENQTAVGKYFADYRFTAMIAPVGNAEIFYNTYETLSYCSDLLPPVAATK